MKLTFIFLLFVSFVSTSFIASAKDRWVKDQGVTSVEVVVTEKSPASPPPVIVVSTNSTIPIKVTVTTNKTSNGVVVYQQTNWPVKVNATTSFEKPVEYKATKVAQQEPRQKRPGFLARFFGPSQAMMTDAISGDKLPANPVRWSERSFTLPVNGTFNFNHSQGTDTYAESSWDENGPRKVFHQSTHNNTYISFYPETRRWIAPTYYQDTGVQARTVTWP